MLARLSIGICLAAAIATLLLIVPGDYCRITTTAEHIYLFVIFDPYE
jgi:hypothetical protein